MKTLPTTNPTDPSIIHPGAHPEHLFLATPQHPQPVTVESLSEILQQETVYWTTMLPTAPAGKTVRHFTTALREERSALDETEQAVQAHARAEWAEACTHYTRAVVTLDAVLSEWRWMLARIASETPFTWYAMTRQEREEQQLPEPLPVSFAQMQEISPFLFRVYQNMDRLFCLGVELTQRLNLCLHMHMQEAERREGIMKPQGSKE